ncbi:biotin--[acetyl-CoA-carboxylase] ligase [Phaeocystidibacter luteus]|uniref:Biotin--[acetyl-CoA-carboxylase] ligase n=1 Tax=Phaeocystidibacter luteus TaxID=911197 RepID=A0A6N6RD13_9FLAO|nr:biotin--[acetyl-CoA-carboxylase] ligase [Phaeocystidibacter luteus]KAB2806806.1 biotin--[acetyl-CoA-carboxylase] ligase [Phaeocystidibacter luteus]
MHKPVFHFHHFDSVDSTNSLLSKYLDEVSPSNWTVFSADSQQNGRGQMGTTWQDEPGANALMSILTPPISWPAQRMFDINMAVSLGIHRALDFILPIQLKWPNDLYFNGSKLGGVLIEPSLRGAYAQRVIVGIGINVHQSKWESGVRATSIALNKPNVPPVEELRKRIAENVAQSIQVLLDTGKVDKQQYLEHCLGYQTMQRYSSNQTEFEAKFVDVDERGRQVLLLPSGEKKVFDLKEVKLVL